MGVAPADRLLTGQALGRRRWVWGGRAERRWPSRRMAARIVFSAERNGSVQLYHAPARRARGDADCRNRRRVQSCSSRPNGESIGFYADGALKRVSLAGGAPVTIAQRRSRVRGELGQRRSGSCSRPQTGGLWRIPASGGGKPELITDASARRDQSSPAASAARWADGVVHLDDGRRFHRGMTRASSRSHSSSGEQKVSSRVAPMPDTSRPGISIYMRRGTLMAVPFDVGRLEVTGDARGTARRCDAGRQHSADADRFGRRTVCRIRVGRAGVHQRRHVSTGSLVARSGSIATGKIEPLNVPAGSYLAPRLSPDGKRVVFNTTTATIGICRSTRCRGDSSRACQWTTSRVSAVWTPDSRAWCSVQGCQAPASCSFEVRMAMVRRNRCRSQARKTSGCRGSCSQTRGRPTAHPWSSGPTEAVCGSCRGKEKAEPRLLFNDATDALEAEFSPDGRWLAYTSGAVQASNQVYVQRLSGAGSSGTGGWRRQLRPGLAKRWTRTLLPRGLPPKRSG